MSDVLHKDKLEEAYELLKEADPRWVNSILDMTREANEKGKVYGSAEDSLSNIKGSEEYGVPAWIGASIEGRNCDRRARNLVKNGVTEGETLRNPILDRAVFDVHALSLYDEGQCEEGDDGIPPFPWTEEEFSWFMDEPFVLWACTHKDNHHLNTTMKIALADWRDWHKSGCPDA